MRTERGSSRTVVFLFAHQDDEFGVFQSIERERVQGARIQIAYLTTGVAAGRSPTSRNAESLRVLVSMGISAEEVVFAGSALGIGDGELRTHLPDAVRWLTSWLASARGLDAVYIPAWEGGHPDHDLLHAAALMAALKAGKAFSLRQYPLYNGYRRPGPLFRVMSPLPQNGRVQQVPIPWLNRLRYLRNCLRYPSQAKSWLGLFPFVAYHYLIRGFESLQDVTPGRLRQRPHDGPLYYERRRFSTWEQVESAVDACLRLDPIGCDPHQAAA